MSKTRDTGFLNNVLKSDTNGNVSIVSGSTTLLYISSSGAITTTGVISGSTIVSASYASNAETLDGLDSTVFTLTSSFNAQTASFTAFSSSHNSFTASILAQTASINAFSASINTATSSFSTRVGALESYTASQTLRNTTYATTASNNFINTQHIADTTNPTGFDTTASLYTEGGLGIKKDSYFSSSLYIKGNLTVYGTQSVAYISSSTLNIGTNLITVNTSTPSVRFGGIAVQDSGSTSGLTGSLLWDSQNNSWLYDNPSGSGNYDSAMVIMGPRNSSTLGSEVGLNCNYLVQGHGHHHTTSSMIFHDGSTTCFPGSITTTDLRYTGNGYITYGTTNAGTECLIIRNGAASPSLTINSTGAACFASSTQAGGFYANGSTTITTPFDTTTTKAYFDASCINGAALTLVSDGTGRTIRLAATTGSTYSGKIDINTGEMNIGTNVCLPFTIYTNALDRMRINSNGITCFACQVCINTSRTNGTNSTALILQDNATGIQTPGYGLRLQYQSNGTGITSAIGMEAGGTGTNNESQISFYTQNVAGALGQRLLISSTGTTCFACQICTPFVSAASVDVSTGGASCPTTACVGYGIFGYSGVGLGITAGASGGNQGIGFFVCGVERGRWISSGNLGIGTVCPGYPLTVYSTNTGHIKAENPNAGGYALYQAKSNGSAYVWQWGAWSDGSYRVGQSGVGDYMTITPNGNVGFNCTGVAARTMVVKGASGCYIVAEFIEPAGVHSIEVYPNKSGYNLISSDYMSGGAYLPLSLSARENASDFVLTTSGKLGLGVANPLRELHIAAAGAVLRVGPDYPTMNSSTDRDFIELRADGTTSQILAPNEVFQIINSGGGGASPYIDIIAGTSGGVRLTNTATSWTGISDIRAKDIIEPVTDAVSKLSNLSTIIYKLKDDETNQRKIGLIAQEVNEVLPEVVDIPLDSCIMWGIRYSEIVPVLVKAVQEQQTTICSQAGRIKLLETYLGIA